MKFETKAIHGIEKCDKETGGIGTTLQFASTYKIREFAKEQPFEYGRVGNPTRAKLEALIARLENGDEGYALASGMAAINVVFSIFRAGDHIIMCDEVYAGTFRLLKIFTDLGVEFTLVDVLDLEKVKKAIKPNTKAIFIETPSNPQFAITDIRGIVEIAKAHKLITIADNTFMTPYLQRPLDLGMDIVLHSATKFLGGHCDILAGLIVAKGAEINERIKYVVKSSGVVLAPFDCWLLIRSITTLKVRMDYEQSSAQKIVAYLKKHPKVTRIYYPTELDEKARKLHESQSDGAGAIFSFNLRNVEEVKTFVKRLELITYAVSLGGVETLASHPYTMSHGSMADEEKLSRGITPEMVRISVGLENPDDLIKEFERVLA